MNDTLVKMKPKKDGGGGKPGQAGGGGAKQAHAAGGAKAGGGTEEAAPKPIERRFDDPERIKEFVEAKKHRSLVGQAWDTHGDLQLKLLVDNGLLPDHTVLDIGCGCLRAGIKIIPYLKPDNYFGIDPRQPLLKAGYKRELVRAALDTRLNRANLFTSSIAEHGRLDEDSVDFGLCIQVMSHYPLNFLRIMLENSAKYFKSGARLFVSFYEVPEGEPYAKPFLNKAGTRSRANKPPFHYFRRDMEYMAKDTVWTPNYIGYWGEPDGQYLMVYTKT